MVKPDHVGAGGEADRRGDCTVRLGGGGRGHRDGAADDDAVHLDVHRLARAGGGHAQVHVVGAPAGDVDRVLHPLSGGGPADVVAGGLGATGGLDVDIVTGARAVRVAAVSGGGVVEADPFPAHVVVLGL